MKKRKLQSNRYAAKLLFQYRVLISGRPNKMRVCEETMIVFRASNARNALAYAKKHGRSRRFRYKDHQGNPVHFEFVGLTDLLLLGPECSREEVWYDIKVIKKPTERARSILPSERKLNAIYWSNAESTTLKGRRAKRAPSTRSR
jgi:hypothetical protein